MADPSPRHRDFMDAEMLDFWRAMSGEDLGGFRLYGGTALAMYLNHRSSIDFDFFKSGVVTAAEIRGIPWLEGARLAGSVNMVDAVVALPSRSLMLNFVNLAAFGGVEPLHDPVRAENGVRVAHPVDILANKLGALSSRKLTRDFYDVAAARLEMPGLLREAVEAHIGNPMSREATLSDMSKTLLQYPAQVEHELAPRLLRALDSLAHSLQPPAPDGGSRGPQPR